MIEEFLRQLKEKGYSESSLKLYRGVLRTFVVKGFSKASVMAFQKRTLDLKPSTRRTYLAHLKRFLTQKFPTLSKEIVIPKVSRSLPKAIPTQSEVVGILQMPDVTTFLGIRDRAILELLYATGLRKTEVRTLKLEDVDWAKRLVRVVQGKGKKDRMVLMNEAACGWLKRYLDSVRGVSQPKESWFFVSVTGQKLGSQGMHLIAKRYGTYSCHKYRHAYATHLLQNGMKETSLQRLLGHSRITTTQIYTAVTITELKTSYAKAHSRDKWPL